MERLPFESPEVSLVTPVLIDEIHKIIEGIRVVQESEKTLQQELGITAGA
jgi:hypothetical protein